jgi:hypothetical protein
MVRYIHVASGVHAHASDHTVPFPLRMLFGWEFEPVGDMLESQMRRALLGDLVSAAQVRSVACGGSVAYQTNADTDE